MFYNTALTMLLYPLFFRLYYRRRQPKIGLNRRRGLLDEQIHACVRLIFVSVIAIFILLAGRLAYLQVLNTIITLYRAEQNRFTR